MDIVNFLELLASKPYYSKEIDLLISKLPVDVKNAVLNHDTKWLKKYISADKYLADCTVAAQL